MNTPFSLRDLEILVAVQRAGSLNRAASRLELTPSALSHRIHDLEARIDQQLVERHGQLRLTPQALALIPRAEVILSEVEALSRHLSHETPPRRVGMSRLMLDGPYLAALTEHVRQSTARYEIKTGHSLEVEDWVDQGDIDVGLVRLERLRPGLRYTLVEEDRLAVVTSNGSPPIGPVGDWPWVLFSGQMGHGAAVRRALRDAGLVVEPRAVVDSLTVALALAESGYVSVLPWSMAEPLVRDGRLTEVPVPDVLWPPRRNVLLTRDAAPDWLPALLHRIQRRLSSE